MTPKQFYSSVALGDIIQHSSGETFILDWYRPTDIRTTDLWLYAKRGNAAYLASECEKINAG